jgi:penicillin-binding protein 2
MGRIQLGPSHDGGAFHQRNRVAMAVVVAGVLMLFARLLLVQVVSGDRYEQYASVERVSKVRATAARGLIRGRDGHVMARNIESHRLEVLRHRVKPARIKEIADTIAGLLDLTDSQYKGLLAELGKRVDPRRHKPLVVRRGLVSTHCPFDSHPLELFGDVTYSFCATCGRTFERPPKRQICPVDRRKLLPSGNGDGLHCATCGREFHDKATCPYDETPVREGVHILHCAMCGRTFNDEVALLRSNLHLLPEARIRTEIQREYPYRYLASHVLGYVARVGKKDMRPFAHDELPRFSINDKIGRAGLERTLDSLLRGIDGEQILVRRRGTEQTAADLDELMAAMRPRQTVPGLTLKLTLDLDLQRTAKVAMRHVHSGAVVALDIPTGEVLVMYSKPSFDPNAWSGRLTSEILARTNASPYAPMLNKAVRSFPPASVFKAVTAAAALEEGVITAKTTHHCPGYYEFGRRRFRCHRRSGHGEVDLQAALERSCDVYFYKVGEQLGLDKIAHWAAKMGLGERTGLELYEQRGRLPTKGWYGTQKGGYYPGFALSTAVGQKDVTASPLQLARLYAGIARNGNLPTVSLIREVISAAGPQELIGRQQPRDMGLSAETIKLVQSGLIAVVEGDFGTARKTRLVSVRMAGKTGTAEAAQRARKGAPKDIVRWLQDDHAWFVGYAPVEAPKIVVAVLVEHGGSGGHVAAPVVKRVMQSWFERHPYKPSDTAPPRAPKPAKWGPLSTLGGHP